MRYRVYMTVNKTGDTVSVGNIVLFSTLEKAIGYARELAIAYGRKSFSPEVYDNTMDRGYHSTLYKIVYDGEGRNVAIYEKEVD
jgi:hypothetical protein